MRYVAILLLLLAGCVSPINSLEGLITEEEYVSFNTVDDVKNFYFKKEALEYIKDIPCVDGVTVSGSYVTGVNTWSILAGILTGSGYSPKCVLNKYVLKLDGVESIIHEYIHHLDVVGRDGGEVLINLDEFRAAYIKTANDYRYAGLVLYTERRANDWVTDIFGIGSMSEHIAYVGARIAKQQAAPDYMWNVFRKVLVNHGK